MTTYSEDELERALGRRLGERMPEGAAGDVNVALRVAGSLEEGGFIFRMRDLCPRSLDECRWQATFTRGGAVFAAEDARPAVAVCAAALVALEADE